MADTTTKSSTTVRADVGGRLEIAQHTNTVRWEINGQARALRYFPDNGVLDYASERVSESSVQHRSDRPAHDQSTRHAAAQLPHFGQPLVVSTTLGAVFWRNGNRLFCAPIRDQVVEWTAAAVVRWPKRPDEYADIEHNLCQMTPGLGPDPYLCLVRIDRGTSFLSIARIIAGPEGEPWIGEECDQPIPYLWWRDDIDQVLATGWDAVVAAWQSALQDQDVWQLLTGRQANDALRAAGYTMPAEFTGADVDQFWGPAWYDGTRIAALARFRAPRWREYTGYMYSASGGPTARPAIVTTARPTDPPYFYAQADAEFLPPDQLIRVGINFAGGARSRTVRAGDVVLEEPILRAGPGPRLRPDSPRYIGFCRRCGVEMNSPESIKWTPPEPISAVAPIGMGMWCPAHPDSTRRRPHAPTCGIDTDPIDD